MGESENKSKMFKSATDKSETDHNYAASSDDQELFGSGAGMSFMTGTGSGKAVVVNLNTSSRSPEEMVFSIPHLLDSILATCDRQTLLNCRLVSRGWAHFGSKALQKTVSIRFRKEHHQTSKTRRYTLCTFEDGQQRRPIKDLITLMKKSAEFPCTSFYLDFGMWNNSRTLTTSLLNSYGTSIRKLQIVGRLDFEDVKSIVLSDAPNLEQLVLSKLFTIPALYTWGKWSLYNEALPGPRPVLKNLKVFKCDDDILEVFVQQILECSPNLVEISVPTNCIHFLVNPVNRLHLLKKLVVTINKKTIESLEIVANQHQNTLAVQEFHFVSYAKWGARDCHSKALDVMSKIIKGCADTCQKVGWIWTNQNFEIPKMPKVKQFSCKYVPQCGGILRNIFSEGGSLGDAFPHLKSFEINSLYGIGNPSNKYLFGVDNPSPVLTVQNVALCSRPNENLLLRLKEIFPNAVIQTDANYRIEYRQLLIE